jgi:RNA polymerase sigma-70 factor (ECF subfamily)
MDAEFRQLFRDEFVYVCRSLRRLGVRAGDADDVAQEVFMTVHARRAEYDPERPRRPWLYAFVVRYAANYRRLKRHLAEPLERVERLSLAPRSSAVEARDEVLRALDQLPDEQRFAFVMHDLEGFEAGEIAALTSAPLNTVYSRIRLGRAAFRAALEAGAREEAAS